MKLIKHNKKIAFSLLLLMTLQLVFPAVSHALTSGPGQPEMKGFEPIGNSDMVDLFSGDFSYNIPLMDVGGYPLNLAYHSGASLDDESSWVGYGWSLNVGSVNRQLRGLPDDFNGTDQQEREMHVKDHTVTGGKFSVSLKAIGIPVSNYSGHKLNLAGATVSLGLKYDNYRGIGMQFGVNTGLSLTNEAAGDKTNNSVGLDVGLNLSSFDGASVNASVYSGNLMDNDKVSKSRSIGLGYNSRSGLTGMTLDLFKAPTLKFDEKTDLHLFNSLGSSYTSFAGESFTPTIDHPTKNSSFTFTLTIGPELFIPYIGFGGEGSFSRQSTAETLRKLPSYGYMYSEKGAADPNALMDLTREKDIPYTKDVKYLPIPIPSYDLFTATSQDGSGQYRAYRGSSGVYSDPKTQTSSSDNTIGIEGGPGTYVEIGANYYHQKITTTTQKWTDRNKILNKLDFQSSGSTPLYEPVYFKRVGEPVPSDDDYLNKIENTSPFAAILSNNISNAFDGAELSSSVRTTTLGSDNMGVLKRDRREIRNTAFSYLTSKEASHFALDKNIYDYKPDSLPLSGCSSGAIKNTFQRNSDYRKPHHISEITITGEDGKRSVYGIPVYNVYQKEVSFSIDADLSKRKTGLIGYNRGVDDTLYNNKGRDNYYSKEVTKPYATSYLLTAILSPDYVDKTGDGVSDDDLGTAVKFNYTRLDSLYSWRTPYATTSNTANYNEGFLSDDKDDKANYVYGKKEIWYIHSIESKTMVAQFILAYRDDGLGVLNDGGGIDSINKLKYLKEIRLFSKSDLKLHNNNPAQTTPIKIVHFVYDYSVCRGLPNSLHGGGKLTLQKVYFTFAENNKGILSPYEFSYDTTYNQYGYRQYDRWNTFKDPDINPGGLNNSEFPYTSQDTTFSNKFASTGQLNKIILPSGGIIKVTYEADDYAYVQDKRASEMFIVKGLTTGGDSVSLINADYLYVDLPTPVKDTSELRRKYFEGINKLYFKFFMDLDGLGHKEFVPGYADIQSIDGIYSGGLITTAKIKLQKLNGKNPIARAGWQFLRMNLPKYAYPNSENIDNDESNLKKTIEALVTAFGSIKELIEGFDKRAERMGYCNKFDKGKSWVRLCCPTKKKIGGGLRVRRIDMSDDWATMSGTTGSKTSTYSQVYAYTTTDQDGSQISSGVASYEPMIGNDENPFRQPLTYEQKQTLGLDNYFYIEQPFCESLFPAPSVGYSKVTVKSVGTGDDETVNRTGTTVSEFYTAKDYPTKVSVLGIDENRPSLSNIFKLVGALSYDIVGLSQGYSIELNDMHGKPKSSNIYNKSGENISSVEYFYKTVNELAESKQLTNSVKAIDETGNISDKQIGLDVETYTDMREQTTTNWGTSYSMSFGVGSIVIFPFPFGFPGFGANKDTRSYRASSSLKIINRFAIQYKVKKTQNGSSITTENLLWDAETGNVLLTKTQNEFDDPIYSFAYPAHWVYDRMGQAYKNLGTILTGFSTNSNGEILNSSYNSLVVPGDELIDINSSNKYWVINSPISAGSANRIINQAGNIQNVSGLTLKLLRSGRRNMANTAIGTITSLVNPIVGDHLDITVLSKILDAKATVFSEEWSMPLYQCNTCPSGYRLSDDGNFCIKDTLPTVDSSCYKICEGDHVLSNYSASGTIIYKSGYNSSGDGTWDTLLTTHFWKADCGTGHRLSTSLTKASRDSSNPLKLTKSNTRAFATVGCTITRTTRSNDTCGPLNRTCIWTCQGSSGDDRLPTLQWIGFSRCITVPTTKTYYLGIASDNDFRITIDGTQILGTTGGGSGNFNYWHIYPISLTAGLHIIVMEGYNNDLQAAFGAEIYNNTAAEIEAATNYSGLKLLFSTRDMLGQEFDLGKYHCPDGYTLSTCDSVFSCKNLIATNFNKVINPYYMGILGNWRAQAQYAYQVARENITDDNKFGTTNIRKSGAYSVFNPFWINTSGTWNQISSSTDERWIAANQVTYFNEKGAEIENKDALNRYSSALFGYLESLPVAVASNAQYREIAYDGFEDYNFNVSCITADSCNYGHFNFKKALGSNATISNLQAHSGKNSLHLTGTISLTKTVYKPGIPALYSFDGSGRLTLGANELAKGFSPIPGKKYILSFWVKDNSPRDPTTGVQASVNGSPLISNLSNWPIVEGWKRIEVPFVLPATASQFILQINPGGSVYMDDIRIHPYDGQLKTFAYDNSSQRLMAELDENNFATFYEYDDEGILIRVKKETDRGIMTIKETRSSYRKR